MPLKSIPCSGCSQPMAVGRGSLPEGKATCRPCRLERRLLGVPTHCVRCERPLTSVQRWRQGSFCSNTCTFSTFGPKGESRGRDYKRRRPVGFIRPAINGAMAIGPGRPRRINIKVFADESITITCSLCYEPTADGWCGTCAVLMTPTGDVRPFAPRGGG